MTLTSRMEAHRAPIGLLRWALVATVLVLIACGRHEAPGGGELGSGHSAAALGRTPDRRPELPRQPALPSDPIVPGDAAGYIPSEGKVTTDGAFAYSIPLDTPRGLGLTPSLSLQYSSRGGGGHGSIGRGWTVAGSSSAITRCRATIATERRADGPDHDGTDSFCLDGKKLVRVKGDEGRREYRTEDDEIAMILPIAGASGGGPGAFEVRTKDGRIRIYE